MEQVYVYLVQNRHRRVESERLHVRNARRVWRQMAMEVIAGTVQLGFTLMDSVDVCRVLLDNSIMALVARAHRVLRVNRRRRVVRAHRVLRVNRRRRVVRVHRVLRVNRRRRVVYVRHVQRVK